MTSQLDAASQSRAARPEQVEGEIVRLSFYNPETGHAVATVQTGNQMITAVGKMPDIQPGASVILEGQWKAHPVYGPQFAVSHLTASRPATLEAMQRYLGSGLVPGLGPVLA